MYYCNPATRRDGPSRPLAQPMRLTLAETRQVSGGGANVQHGNPGGEPASYNTPGNEGYGRAREGLEARDEYISHQGA